MRVGIVGVGSMGQNHARIFSDVAELVGVVDAEREVGEATARRFGTSFFPTPDDLYREDIEAVSIATPTRLHYDVAHEAVASGIHVLLEKPFTGDPKQAEKLTQEAEDRGVVLAAGLIERHNPCVEFAHDALREGAYGKLIAISTRRVSSFPTRVRDVGVMMDLGIHDVDVLRYLVGTEVERVYSVAGRERHDDFEDHATALLTFRGGVTGTVEVNWLTPMKVRRLALTCLNNFVEVDYIDQTVDISSSSLPKYDPSNLYQAPFEYETRQVALKKEEPLRRELGDFLGAIEEDRKPLVDGKEAIQTLKVVTAIAEAQRTGAPVEVD
ncbi:MAG: Gfo/Idh/MocA family oxidoreductase [Thermoplasmata archaeon]